MKGIQAAIQKLGEKGDEVYAKICVVEAVNGKTCTLKPVDGSSEIIDVPFSADTDNDGIINHPLQGSMVLAAFTDKDSAVICGFSQVELSEIKIGTVTLRITDYGFVIKKGDDSLQKLMKDLITKIRAMKFTTNTGATIQLLNDADFAALEIRFNELLKHA
jgi:hypothetical protein